MGHKKGKLSEINEILGKGEMNRCDYCRSLRVARELNYEAKIHHGAKDLRCIDRKKCEKRKRQLKK